MSCTVAVMLVNQADGGRRGRQADADAAVITGLGGHLLLERRLVDLRAADGVLEKLLLRQRAELWKSCSAAASWACSLCRTCRPWGGNCCAVSAANSVPRCSEAWSSARASAVRLTTSLDSVASLVPAPVMAVKVSSVSIELV